MEEEAISPMPAARQVGPPAADDPQGPAPDDAAATEHLDPAHQAPPARRAPERQAESWTMAVHELRGPLMPIRNVSALLARQPAAGNLVELSAVLDRQVRHLTRLIDDLLDATRAASGRMHLRSAPVDLVRLLHEVVQAHGPSTYGRCQHLAVRLPDGPLMMDGDELRLLQVFTNLLHNAYKYTPLQGVVAIACSVEACEDGRDMAVVSIADNGMGITAVALPTVFEPFAQDPRAPGVDGDGLGIGLTVVRELVRAHGGTVTALSPGPDLGSQFVVRLPLQGRDAPRQGVTGRVTSRVP